MRHHDRPVRPCRDHRERGPRPLFRQKLRRKSEAWQGEPIDDRLLVLENPWACFTFADENHRAWLAESITRLELDVLFVGPLTRVGMNEHGTLQETRDFSALLADVRARAGRPITFILIHHQAKNGAVSGAWEGAGDTLLHVQGQGHGRTRLVIQKARWASGWHGKSMQLLWADGERFTISEDAQVDANTIADNMIAAARTHGGSSWRVIQTEIGGNAERARQIRDQLIDSGRLRNTGTETRGQFWDTDDPLCPVRLDTDTPLDTPGGERS